MIAPTSIHPWKDRSRSENQDTSAPPFRTSSGASTGYNFLFEALNSHQADIGIGG